MRTYENQLLDPQHGYHLILLTVGSELLLRTFVIVLFHCYRFVSQGIRLLSKYGRIYSKKCCRGF